MKIFIYESSISRIVLSDLACWEEFTSLFQIRYSQSIYIYIYMHQVWAWLPWKSRIKTGICGSCSHAWLVIDFFGGGIPLNEWMFSIKVEQLKGRVWVRYISEWLSNLRILQKFLSDYDEPPIGEPNRGDLHMMICFCCLFQITMLHSQPILISKTLFWGERIIFLFY